MNTNKESEAERTGFGVEAQIMPTSAQLKQAGEGNAPRIGIGSRVKCNKLFAHAFEGQKGTITGTRKDAFGVRLWTVTFDTPTPAATGWEPLKTLAASAECYDLIDNPKA